MKKIILLFFSFVLLLSACTKDPKKDSADPTNPADPTDSANLTETPASQKSPPQEMKVVRINQDLTLKENPLNIEAAGDLARTYPIYYGNNKCVLANVSLKHAKTDPWTKKQLKKNEIYKVIGFNILSKKRKDFPTARTFIDTRLTVHIVDKISESVHIWINCFGDEAAQITSPADVEKLLNNVISFLDEENFATNNFHVFGPSSSKASRLFGTDESLTSKRIRINDDHLFDDSYKNEKCSIHVIGGERNYQVRYYEYSLKSILFQKGGHSSYADRETLKLTFINDFNVWINISCDGEEFTLSTSPSDIEKLMDGFLYFSK